MKHLIIGTAGHVDHGKSALIRALTGVETDRFPEEKERGISIDIGFAQFRLPSGRQAAVVDVPGHERFIRNMLAGATGIDLVLLVVAADEGVMPQTREHLDILQLLEVKRGLVAVTKRDLVDDELLELVTEEISEAVRGTFLEGAPVLPVSSMTGEGLPALVVALDQLLEETEAKDVTGFARLPIDRAFVRTGFGTVVTGTLVAGTLREGDRLELLPLQQEVRIRGLQVHGEPVVRAEAGQRVAVNLSGVERSQVRRGQVLCATGVLRPTASFAGRLQLLPSWPKALKHGTRVHLHTGTSQVLGRVLLLEGDQLEPGDSAYVQIKTEEPLVVGRGDHFIIRSYSPVHTMGGGVAVEPHANYKRADAAEAIAELKMKERGGTAGVLSECLAKSGRVPLSVAELAKRSGMPADVIVAELPSLAEEVRALEGGLLIHRRGLADFLSALGDSLDAYYRQYPLRLGPAKEELRRRFGMGGKEYAALLAAAEAAGEVELQREWVIRAGRRPVLTPEDGRLADRVLQTVRGSGFTPPTLEELRQALKAPALDELVTYLADQGQVVRVGEDLIVAAETLEEAARRVREQLRARGRISVAEVRDLLGTSRKYALPFLEWLDEQRITRRSGEERSPGPNL